MVYHGSPMKLEVPTPRPSKRFRGDQVLWSGQGVFATPDRRVALVYTANRPDQIKGQYTTGVDLIKRTPEDAPVTLVLLGGRSEDDALEKLYGPEAGPKSFGYIYCLDERGFQREKGLGKWKW